MKKDLISLPAISGASYVAIFKIIPVSLDYSYLLSAFIFTLMTLGGIYIAYRVFLYVFYFSLVITELSLEGFKNMRNKMNTLLVTRQSNFVVSN